MSQRKYDDLRSRLLPQDSEQDQALSPQASGRKQKDYGSSAHSIPPQLNLPLTPFSPRHESKISTTHNPYSAGSLDKLNIDILTLIVEYMRPEDVINMRQANSMTRSLFSVGTNRALMVKIADPLTLKTLVQEHTKKIADLKRTQFGASAAHLMKGCCCGCCVVSHPPSLELGEKICFATCCGVCHLPWTIPVGMVIVDALCGMPVAGAILGGSAGCGVLPCFWAAWYVINKVQPRLNEHFNRQHNKIGTIQNELNLGFPQIKNIFREITREIMILESASDSSPKTLTMTFLQSPLRDLRQVGDGQFFAWLGGLDSQNNAILHCVGHLSEVRWEFSLVLPQNTPVAQSIPHVHGARLDHPERSFVNIINLKITPLWQFRATSISEPARPSIQSMMR